MPPSSGELDETAVAETVASRDDSPGDAAEVALPEAAAGRYAVGAEIGRGGLGRVLRARDDVLARTVAIKELRATDDASRRRFVREALITARLQHPSIVPIYDAGRWPDRAPFYAMKLVGGKPLHEVVAAAPSLAARLALVPTVLAVADAIAYAHSERIVHRDLKPHNVLVGEFGETIVIDWGLAKDLARDDRDAGDAGPQRAGSGEETVAGAVLGTPAYMPPEQAAGKDVDERADVYALGALLYHVISGRAPHEGASVDDMIARVLAGDIAPLAALEPRTPPDLAAIVAKAMAHAPGARYPSARELAEDLRQFTTGQLVGAHRYSLGERVQRWLRRHRAVAAVGAAAVVVLLGFAGWSFHRIAAERDTAVARQRDATARGNQAILEQATRSLDREPAATLAKLRELDPDGPGWDRARVLAADALARPRLVQVIEGVPSLSWTAYDHRLVGSGRDIVAIVDLDRGAMQSYRVPEASALQPTWTPCRDGKRMIGYAAAGLHVAYELDLATGSATALSSDGDRDWLALQACSDLDRFDHEEGSDRLRWFDGQATRVLAEHGVADAWATRDGKHAWSIDKRGDITWWDPEHDRHSVFGTVERGPHAAPGFSADGRVAMFPGRTARLIRVDEVPPAGTWSGDVAAVASDGSLIALAGSDGVAIYRGNGDAAGRLDITSRVTDLEFTHDGRWLLALGERPLAIDSSVRTIVPLGGPEDAPWPIGGERFARISRDGVLRVFELQPVRVLASYEGMDAALSPDGRWLVAVLYDRVRRFHLRGALASDEAAMTAFGGIVGGIAIGDDGTVIARVGTRLSRWPSGGAPSSLATTVEVDSALQWSPTGAAIVVTRDRIVEVSDRGERAIWHAAPGEAILAAARDARTVALAQPDGSIAVTALASGARHVVRVGPATRYTLSPDGRTLAAVTPAGVWVSDVETDRPAVLSVGSSDIGQLAFDATGERLAAATSTSAWLWDVSSHAGRVVAAAPAHDVAYAGDQLIVALERGVVAVADDLPREPAALSARLRALPFVVDANGIVRVH